MEKRVTASDDRFSADRRAAALSRARAPRKGRAGGYTLLLTLLTLVILASVVGHFISENTLHLRASSHRLERTQTRYAAESGIILGSQILTDVLRLSATSPQPTQPPVDPNSDLPMDDMSEPSFVLQSRTMRIGDVDVTIEIHDENAKWPMLWLVRSPLGDSRRAQALAEQSLERLAQLLDADSDALAEPIDLARDILKGMELPPTEKVVQLPGRSSQARTRRRHVGYKRKLAEKQETHQTMTLFAGQWSRQMRELPDSRSLRTPPPGRSHSFVDYLGVWGNSYLNINTVSAEVLQSALQDYGMTMRNALDIVQGRAKEPLKSIRDVTKLVKVDEALATAIYSLCDVRSNVFSLHVNARLGRTSYELVGGLFKTSRGEIKRSAVFPGE